MSMQINKADISASERIKTFVLFFSRNKKLSNVLVPQHGFMRKSLYENKSEEHLKLDRGSYSPQVAQM